MNLFFPPPDSSGYTPFLLKLLLALGTGLAIAALL